MPDAINTSTVADPPPSPLYRTLADLIARPLTGVRWCNVYVRIAGRPYTVDDRGGRWQLAVTGLHDDAVAIVSVHRQPARSALPLAYDRTSPELLELFDDPVLARLLVPGEVALIQANPQRGLDGLYLNVPSVFVARPFRTFGRQQIDSRYGGGGARRKYLWVIKGVGRLDESYPVVTGGGVGGFIAEDVFRALAERSSAPAVGAAAFPPAAGDTAFVRDALSEQTIGRLGFLALAAGPREVALALRKGTDALQTLRADPRAAAVLHQGPWAHETDALRNGVDIAPDFLAPLSGRVLEIKHVNPTGEYADAGKWAV